MRILTAVFTTATTIFGTRSIGTKPACSCLPRHQHCLQLQWSLADFSSHDQNISAFGIWCDSTSLPSYNLVCIDTFRGHHLRPRGSRQFPGALVLEKHACVSVPCYVHDSHQHDANGQTSDFISRALLSVILLLTTACAQRISLYLNYSTAILRFCPARSTRCTNGVKVGMEVSTVYRQISPNRCRSGVSKTGKRLSYHRETARRAMLANSCYVSRGMGDRRKVSNSKSGIQGH